MNIKVGEKHDISQKNRVQDEAQQLQHFQSWESYWGKPGMIHHTLRHNKDGKDTSVQALYAR